MNDYIRDLKETVERAYQSLSEISETDAEMRSAPDKWSPKEIIGHLIDSASNNHQRFVRSIFTDDLIFPGYNQEEWVKVQHYQQASWNSLLLLWSQFNFHLVRVMESIPDEVKFKEYTKHNLHEIAWQKIPEGEATTLDYFMNDYVEHLKHHLSQSRLCRD